MCVRESDVQGTQVQHSMPSEQLCVQGTQVQQGRWAHQVRHFLAIGLLLSWLRHVGMYLQRSCAAMLICTAIASLG